MTILSIRKLESEAFGPTAVQVLVTLNREFAGEWKIG
jgi:hypothetical protein